MPECPMAYQDIGLAADVVINQHGTIAGDAL